MKFIAENISVDRGIRRIVNDACFTLEEGAALIVTGTNGAGKSTLLRALCGLLPLAAGRLQLAGIGEGETDPAVIREYIHYLGPQNAMKPALTVRENLEFWTRFSNGGNPDPAMSVEEALDFVELPHAIDLPFSYLSTGMRRRAAIARLLVTDKPVWIVDEPTSGLDTRSSEIFTSLCRDYCADGGILIAATHLPLGLENARTMELERLHAVHDGLDVFGTGA